MYIGNIFPTSILNKVFSDCCEQSTLDANATKGLHIYVYCTYIIRAVTDYGRPERK